MADALCLFAAFALTYLAFASFALMQQRHWQVVTVWFGCAMCGRGRLQLNGVVCLVAGLAIVLWHEGPAYGFLLWVTQLSIAACGVVATLSLRPRLLRTFAMFFARALTDGSATRR